MRNKELVDKRFMQIEGKIKNPKTLNATSIYSKGFFR